MLEVALHEVSSLAVRDVTFTVPKSTHTGIVGPSASGVSSLLRLIAGESIADSGSITIGARDVTRLRRHRRPLLYVTRDIDAPRRWSVRHLLVAAVRRRSLDRVDRQREFDLAASKWKLTALLDRRLDSLSTSERVAAHLASIELLKPAILVADRLVDSPALADDFYRTLRVLGTTVISAPSATSELGFTDEVIVMEAGRIAQRGTFSHVYRHPSTQAAAIATGEVNLIPVTVRGTAVESPIGAWAASEPPFQGNGIAAARPHDFAIAEKGEESDVIFGIEEATFRGDRWLAKGFLTGGITLLVSLPAETAIHKGRLLALRYDANRFTLVAR